MRARPPARGDYPLIRPIATRWADNDVYGHVNNVVYYSYFDTLVNANLVELGLLDLDRGDTICLVVSSGCDYFAPLAFPQAVEGGLRIDRLGTSAITYAVALFAPGGAWAAAAGHLTHVRVGRADRRPRALDPAWRAALAPLHRPA